MTASPGNEWEDPHVIEWMRTLHVAESAGERAEIKVGPFSAITMIGALQLAIRHPDVTGRAREIILDICRQFYPLFMGTPGEEIIRRGEHPEQDPDR